MADRAAELPGADQRPGRGLAGLANSGAGNGAVRLLAPRPGRDR
ncbi:hypothetical protein [Mycobacterium kiyosense]